MGIIKKNHPRSLYSAVFRHTWTHTCLSVDTATGTVSFVVNGDLVASNKVVKEFRLRTGDIKDLRNLDKCKDKKWMSWNRKKVLGVFRGFEFIHFPAMMINDNLRLSLVKVISRYFVFSSCDWSSAKRWLRHSLTLSRLPTYISTFYTHKTPCTLINILLWSDKLFCICITRLENIKLRQKCVWGSIVVTEFKMIMRIYGWFYVGLS